MVQKVISRKGDTSDYDMENDSFFAYSSKMKYKSSIDINGIILDVAEDNSIMGVEILDVSNRLGVSKFDMKNYKSLEMTVDISENVIEVEITFGILKRNRPIPHVVAATALNSMHLPEGSGSLAVVA
ncbi:MAG: hypothetical protein PWQ51_2546 [Methanolobus sp.]|jgi:uncharacterized protein YuzE|uniref:DUF2283 domain-containing protein n=1 Tax=Methanolobus tindarius DSM 2278 TaxID=1090322 RepID=W9DRQ5_METTI|nr:MULTISPECIES: DUF2283 domain-containing protein [Methanolobus]ETA68250.1 Protein of unknown function (DUF2283) [Methanolobus tindarius DSM 2278]MDK2830933.1 hypothetical protein [Methanolobus sp.]MDK2940381.1 hypothetical protein [Methanolobus sp.]